MNARRLTFLVAVLALLLGMGAWLRTRERTASSLQPAAATLVPDTLTLDSLDSIELSIGKAESPSVKIAKDSKNGWRVSTAFNAPADPEKLTRLIGALRGLTGEERARGEKWLADFGLGEKALRLTLRQGEQKTTALMVGRGKKDWGTHFVRPLDRDAIYAVETDLLSEAGLWGELSSESLSSKSWVDLRLFPVDPISVSSAELAQRVKESWLGVAERHPPFDSETRDWLAAVTSLRGSDLLDPEADGGAFKPVWRWTLLLKGGGRLELEEAAADKEEGPVKVRRLPDGTRLAVSAALLRQYREQILPSSKKPK